MRDRTAKVMHWMAAEGASIVGSQVFILTAFALNVGTSVAWTIALGIAGGLGLATYTALRLYRRALVSSPLFVGVATALSTVSI